MKLIKPLSCCVLFLNSAIVLAAQETSDFTPYFAIETGIATNTLNEFEQKGFSLDYDNFALKLGALYQFTPQWSAQFDVATSIGDSDAQFQTNENSEYTLTGIHFKTTLFSMEAGYTMPLSESWQLDLNAGVIVGKEKEEISACPEASPLSWSRVCSSHNGVSTSSDTSIAASYILGASIMYIFFDDWGIKLGHSYSGYKEGFSQTELLVQYRF